MIGTSATTGKHISGIDHLRQSIRDILTTPIGSRIMRREYGSRLFELIDAPMNDATRVDMIAATAEALATWEPRISVDEVSVEAAEAGKFTLSLVCTYLPDGTEIEIDGIEVT